MSTDRSQVEAGSDLIKQVPKAYHSIYPLDVESKLPSTDPFPYPTLVFKVVRESDGAPFAMRRVDKLRTTADILTVVVKAWARIAHPCVYRRRSA